MMLTSAMMLVALCSLYRDRLNMGQDGEDGISKPEYLRKIIWMNDFSSDLSTVRKESLMRCLKQDMKMVQKKERVIKKMVMIEGIKNSQPSLYRIM